MKKTAIAVIVMSFTALALTACDPTSKGDTTAVVKCNIKGLKKASFSEKHTTGKFFVCGGAKCIVTVRFPDTGSGANKSSDRHTLGKYKYPKTFTVPKGAKSFSASHCGTLFYKGK